MDFHDLERAYHLCDEGDFGEALAIFTGFSVEDLEETQRERLLYYWGYALSQTGDYQGALDRFRRALHFAQHPHRFHEAIGNTYSLLGDERAATDAYETALRACSDPTEAMEVQYNWGLMLRDLGLYEDAAEKFRLVVESDPESPDPHYSYGWTLDRLGEYSAAVEQFDRALEKSDDGDVDALICKGNALSMLGRKIEAVRSYRRALARQDDNASAYYNWSVVLWHLEQPEEALVKARRAIDLAPEEPAYHAQRGFLALQLHRATEARQALARAVELGTDDTRTYLDYVQVLREAGARAEADAALRRGSLLDENHCLLDDLRRRRDRFTRQGRLWDMVLEADCRCGRPYTRRFEVIASDEAAALAYCGELEDPPVAATLRLRYQELLEIELSDYEGVIEASERRYRPEPAAAAPPVGEHADAGEGSRFEV